jgi:glutathione S-transferase
MLIVHHISVCPFSQRLEILLALKGCTDQVSFRAVDITRPRPSELLALTGGGTAMPILALPNGVVLRESLVILRYLDSLFAQHPVAQADPLLHAQENLLASQERDFGDAGYRLLMNRDPTRREALRLSLLEQYGRLDELLCRFGNRNASTPWLGQGFGWAELVFAPLFMRFWCLGYYEGFELPEQPRYARVRAWEAACLAHPAAQQVSREQVLKLYYDYALGMGNGALAPGRALSSFAFEPHWSKRPWPPQDKYGQAACDGELGLC